MFATIRRYQGQPGQTEKTIQRVKDGLIPILSKQPGFVSYHAIDAGNLTGWPAAGAGHFGELHRFTARVYPDAHRPGHA